MLRNYPKTKRDLQLRNKNKTKYQQDIARKFDFEFFDGDRQFGYGGYYYNEKYWKLVVKDFIEFYNLKPGMKFLDVGCGKGFMLYEFQKTNIGFEMCGLDISNYALDNSVIDLKADLYLGGAESLPFKSNHFDLVISINTIHNLELEKCKQSLREICRVSKSNKFIVVDAYRDDDVAKK